MKTLTHAHKKWVLAGCLLASLASHSTLITHHTQAGSVEFASTSVDQVPTTIPTAEGVVKVIYIKSGDNEVMAVVPKADGQTNCNYCGSYTIPMSIGKNKENLEQLNVALLKKMKESKTTEVAEKKPLPAVTEENKEAGSWSAALASIEVKCDTKKSNDAQLSCYSSDLSKVLKSKSIKIDQTELVEFFKEKISPLIRNEIEHSRNTLSSIVGAKQYMSQEDYFWAMSSAEEEIYNIDERKKVVSDYLKTIIESTKAEHSKFRTALLQAQTTIMRENAQQIRQLRQSEKQVEKSNPALAVQYGIQATNQTSDLLRWNSLLSNSNYLSIQNLKDRGDVSSNEYNVYENYLRNFSETLAQYLVKDPYGKTAAQIPTLQGVPQTGPAPAQLDPRVQQGQRIQGPAPQGTLQHQSQTPTVGGSGSIQIMNSPYQATKQQLDTRNQIHQRYRK